MRFLNLGLATVTMVLAMLLSLIYVLRITNRRILGNRFRLLVVIDRALRKCHRQLGNCSKTPMGASSTVRK